MNEPLQVAMHHNWIEGMKVRHSSSHIACKLHYQFPIILEALVVNEIKTSKTINSQMLTSDNIQCAAVDIFHHQTNIWRHSTCPKQLYNIGMVQLTASP